MLHQKIIMLNTVGTSNLSFGRATFTGNTRGEDKIDGGDVHMDGNSHLRINHVVGQEDGAWRLEPTQVAVLLPRDFWKKSIPFHAIIPSFPL